MLAHDLAKKLLELPNLEVWFNLPCEEGAVRGDINVSCEESHACYLDLDEALGDECSYEDENDLEIKKYSPIIYIYTNYDAPNYNYKIQDIVLNLLGGFKVNFNSGLGVESELKVYDFTSDKLLNQYAFKCKLTREVEVQLQNKTYTSTEIEENIFTNIKDFKNYLEEIGYDKNS